MVGRELDVDGRDFIREVIGKAANKSLQQCHSFSGLVHEIEASSGPFVLVMLIVPGCFLCVIRRPPTTLAVWNDLIFPEAIALRIRV